MLLGLDLGTSSVKALLMEENGGALGEGSAPYPVLAPRPGWAESSPEDWWAAVLEATDAAVGRRGAGGDRRSGSRARCTASSSRTSGVFPCGPPSSGPMPDPAPSWRPTGGSTRDLRRRLANPPAVGMAGPSLLWLRDNEPDDVRVRQVGPAAEGLAQDAPHRRRRLRNRPMPRPPCSTTSPPTTGPTRWSRTSAFARSCWRRWFHPPASRGR